MWVGVIHNKHLLTLGRIGMVQAGAVQAAERGAQVREQTLLPLARLRPGAKPCKLKVLEEHTPCAWDTINLTADGLCLRVGIDWNTVAG